MPTYEYKCTVCGNTFEYFQKMTDDPKSICEECGGNLKRLIGAGIGPIFKGSGFYQTDYKGNGKESSAKKEPGSSEAKKTETKTTEKKAS